MLEPPMHRSDELLTSMFKVGSPRSVRMAWSFVLSKIYRRSLRNRAWTLLSLAISALAKSSLQEPATKRGALRWLLGYRYQRLFKSSIGTRSVNCCYAQ